MTSELHETLVDEIRFSFSRFMRQHGYQFRGNVGFVGEAIVANIFTGLVGIGLTADGYIFPNDGYGVIPQYFSYSARPWRTFCLPGIGCCGRTGR